MMFDNCKKLEQNEFRLLCNLFWMFNPTVFVHALKTTTMGSIHSLRPMELIHGPYLTF